MLHKFPVLSLLLIIALFGSCNQQTPADLILYNAIIYTMDEAQPQVEAVAVRDGKIVYAGSKSGTEAYKGTNTEVLDLKGKTVVPGLIESHGHYIGVGKLKMELDLLQTTSYDQVLDALREAVSKAQPGEWITGRGWHQSKWGDNLPDRMVKGFPTHDDISAIAPDNPVVLRHASGHGALANAKAMELANITRQTTYDETGEVIKDENGEPTGYLNEEAERLVGNIIPFTPEMHQRSAELAMQECLSNGITALHDAGVDQKTIDIYQSMAASGDLGVRLYVMLNGLNDTLLNNWFEKGPSLDEMVTVRSIKLYADGALGSRGALLLEPYTDAPETMGLPDMPMEKVLEICQNALKYGFQVGTHAIGDKANRQVLNQYQTAFEGNPEAAKDHRFRVEHAQHLHPDDIPRFAELGVIASMQGIHMASDRPWAIDRLGKLRIQLGAYVWARLLDSGARIINGTDAPVEPISPIASFYASVTRQTLMGKPEGGYEPDQKMTREQALRSYTLDAAYGGFMEDKIGSIEVGKLGDFTVLSQDIMTVPDDQILNTEIDYTIVGGQIRYNRTEPLSVFSR